MKCEPESATAELTERDVARMVEAVEAAVLDAGFSATEAMLTAEQLREQIAAVRRSRSTPPEPKILDELDIAADALVLDGYGAAEAIDRWADAMTEMGLPPEMIKAHLGILCDKLNRAVKRRDAKTLH
jgi:hypothetical protein